MINLIPIKKLTEDYNCYLNSLSFPENPENLYKPLSYFLNLGGKRIRPLLVLLAHQLFDKDYSKSFPAATAIEYFHNFSLIHDDIMDEAPLRRGEKSIHTKWNMPIAILSGDVLLVNSYQQLSLLPADCLSACLTLFNKTAIEVCEGQQQDMDFENIEIVSTDDYLKMIKLKTSVLLASSLKIGAIISKADENQQDILYNLGIKIGLSFQIQDDYLDLFNDNPLFGKIIGGDLLQNKKTILSTTAIETLGETEYLKFKNNIKNLDDYNKVLKYKEFFKSNGIVNQIFEIQSKYSQEINELTKNLTTIYPKNNLIDIIELILERKH